jgi:hypothetical protein
MNRFLKTAVLSVAVGATMVAALPAANAGDRYRYRHYHHSHHWHGDAAVAGIAGLAAGALIGSALSRPAPPPPYYDDYDAPPRYVVRRDVVVRRAPAYYAGGIEPWTRDWYEYCSDRYRSFNARTGTFTGYDGERHFCVAN